jgi:hypothetical protein
MGGNGRGGGVGPAIPAPRRIIFMGPIYAPAVFSLVKIKQRPLSKKVESTQDYEIEFSQRTSTGKRGGEKESVSQYTPIIPEFSC